MASGWAQDGAVQDQIDATVDSEVERAKTVYQRREPDPLRRVRCGDP